MSLRFIFGLPGIILLIVLQALAQQSQHAVAPAQQGFSIAGVMVNSVNGQPVGAATVVIAPVTARSSVQSLVTGADGRFSFSGLPAGKYSIEAGAQGYREQGWNQHDNYATAVVVGRDLDASHIVFRLQPDASIEGHIIDQENEPVQNATVRLFRKDAAEGQQKAIPRENVETDDQGYYRIGHLAPGTYYLAVGAHPWYAQNGQTAPAGGDRDAAARSDEEAAELDKAFPLTFYPDALDSAGASPILLHAGEHYTADLTLQAMRAVHLRMREPSAKAGAQPMFQINLKQRIFDRLEPVLQGVNMSYTNNMVEVWGLPPGHYLVEVRPSSRNGQAAAAGWYQEIDLAGDVELTAAASPGFADVSGIVRFAGGPAPQGRVFLMMRNRETGENFGTPLSPDGQFSFREDRLRPGTYEIVIGNAQGFALQKMAATGATVTGRTLEITSPTTVHLAGIASHGIGVVNGIAQRDGKGVAGAMIVLVPNDPAHNQPLFRRDQSDSDGTFTLPNVVPGSYTVVAIDNGWELEWADPTLLQRYLKNGEPVQVPGGGALDVKVQVQ